MRILNLRIADGDETSKVILPIRNIPVNTYLPGETTMTRSRNIVTAGILVLSFATASFAGTITGSRTGTTGSKVGTITGSRAGTITGSKVGTITGSRTGTITGSNVGITRVSVDNLREELVFRLLRIIMAGTW